MLTFAKRMDGVTGSAIRELFKLMTNADIISFGGGNPSKDSFPVDTVRRIADECLKDNGVALLQYGPTEGYLPLREAYLKHIVRPRGIQAELENALITTGSMQALDLTLKVLLDPGDRVLVESPTFLGALQAFAIAQAKCVPVPMDDEGVVIEELERLMKEHKPKLFYCIPTFQNPTGRTLGALRRKRIAELAREHNVIVLEDDPYCDLRYRGETQPPIKSFDTSDQVLLFNSFSKSISPGLRVGCALGAPEIIRKMTVCKQCTDTHTTLLTQAIVAEFLNRGLLPGHLASIIPGYTAQLDTMLEGMDKYFPEGAHYVRPEGGLFIWCELKPGADALPLFKRATAEHKVAFIPGEHFFVDGSGKNTLRLNFSSEPVERIKIGIQKLGELLCSAQG
ncbi:MAG: PLP-dependent aminotransferase family protein [Bacillota bacterium]